MEEAHLRLYFTGALGSARLVWRVWRRGRRSGTHWHDTCKSQQHSGKCTTVISGRSVEVEAALRGARLVGPPAKVLTALATLYSLTPSRLLPTPGAPPSLCPSPGALPSLVFPPSPWYC